jgi:hypothetical protein
MPVIYPLFVALYGEPSIQALASGYLLATIEKGLRQGCPLAQLIFNLVIKPALLKAAAAAPEATILFFADDGNVEGPVAEVKLAVMVLVEEFAKVGLEFNYSKSLFYDGQPVVDGLRQELMGVRHDGEEVWFTRVLGAKIVGRAVGDEDFVQAAVKSKLDQLGRALEKFTWLDPDVALLLLTHCVNTRPSYMARAYPPSVIQEGLRGFDGKVDECLTGICRAAGAWWTPTLRGLTVDLGEGGYWVDTIGRHLRGGARILCGGGLGTATVSNGAISLSGNAGGHLSGTKTTVFSFYSIFSRESASASSWGNHIAFTNSRTSGTGGSKGAV